LRSKNPRLVGIDLQDAAEIGAGLALTAYVNDNLAMPLAKQFMPSLWTGTVGRLGEALMTAVSAATLASIAGMVHRGWSRPVLTGGGALAATRAVGVVIPNYGITATTPLPAGFFQSLPFYPQPKAAPVAAVTAGSSGMGL
jgi:hypothetical protein